MKSSYKPGRQSAKYPHVASLFFLFYAFFFFFLQTWKAISEVPSRRKSSGMVVSSVHSFTPSYDCVRVRVQKKKNTYCCRLFCMVNLKEEEKEKEKIKDKNAKNKYLTLVTTPVTPPPVVHVVLSLSLSLSVSLSLSLTFLYILRPVVNCVCKHTLTQLVDAFTLHLHMRNCYIRISHLKLIYSYFNHLEAPIASDSQHIDASPQYGRHPSRCHSTPPYTHTHTHTHRLIDNRYTYICIPCVWGSCCRKPSALPGYMCTCVCVWAERAS